MLRYFAFLVVIPLLFFTLVLIIIRAQPYDDHELRQLLLPEGCPTPCFMGIRPGVTTMDEARAILEASGWATEFHLASGINLTGTDTFISLTWEWNDQRSPLLDTTSPAFIVGFKQSTDAVVDEIYVATTIPLGLFATLLKNPQHYRFGMLFPTASVTAKILARILALYDKVETSANIVCPLKLGGIWNLKSNLYLYSQAPVNQDIHVWDNRAVILDAQISLQWMTEQDDTLLRSLLSIPITIFTAILLVIHAQPYDDHELRQLLMPDGCPAPCFMGIRPRETTVDKALNLLRLSGWIKEIDDHTNDLGMIIWHWDDQSSLIWTRGQSAGFSIVYDRVDDIILHTKFRLWEIRLLLGIPDMEFVNTDKSQTIHYVNYWGGYYQHGLVILGSQPCNAIQPLLQEVTITIGWVSKSSTYADHSFGDSLDAMFRVC